jgi:hypothetical protein
MAYYGVNLTGFVQFSLDFDTIGTGGRRAPD